MRLKVVSWMLQLVLFLSRHFVSVGSSSLCSFNQVRPCAVVTFMSVKSRISLPVGTKSFSLVVEGHDQLYFFEKKASHVQLMRRFLITWCWTQIYCLRRVRKWIVGRSCQM
ncbi:hypothetical protein P153DRAFT_186373 [Dothidotthia symphoricarpi CBS 119687]|uniref:Secreted protein n=1 Tax=Dothidotthia symphoricarpi CBS 119687 TaxID=1392245 RepID=A0A6A6ANW1_9PLEO|nr:uncharacterized protein P153DRAFT_186373 [Dothidotthia symphoricarpi CBS 119687]KAF2132181.1 hypothetical protein P153DRAFT_186373 [Dothidotthia symphoricarpi CBS 119687]